MTGIDTRTIEAVRSFLQELFPDRASGFLWLAGGSVRDALLGRVIRDIDLVAVLPAGVLKSRGFTLVEGVTTTPVWFRHFPGFGNLEITLLESRDCLAEDLRRRDFTVNAMLMDLDGQVTDLLGGRADLERMTLVPCSDGVFNTDPFRIFRGFRFEAEGFVLSQRAVSLIGSRVWEGELERMPVERFGREMLKALEGALPGRFFQQMVTYDVGRGVLPELFVMKQIPAGPPQYHPEGDLLTHSLQVLERVAALTGSPLARFCAFFHDIGKLATDPGLHPRHHGHEEAGFRAAGDFCRRLALPSAFGRALAWTCRLHGTANRFAELRPATRLGLAEQALRAGIEELLPLVSDADKPGTPMGGEWRALLEVAGMNTAALGIDPERLANLEPRKRSAYIQQRRIEFLVRSGVTSS